MTFPGKDEYYQLARRKDALGPKQTPYRSHSYGLAVRKEEEEVDGGEERGEDNDEDLGEEWCSLHSLLLSSLSLLYSCTGETPPILHPSIHRSGVPGAGPPQTPGFPKVDKIMKP